MKLEDKDKLKILSESQTDPKFSSGGSLVPKSPDSTPGLNLPSDFFFQEERTSSPELEGVMLEIAFNAMERRSVL